MTARTTTGNPLLDGSLDADHRRLPARIRSIPALVGIVLVHAYRWTLGLLVPAGTCKYHPSCSEYAILALRRHGLVKGSAKAAWRVLRCNPWSHGGVDHP
jgi:putative membrane protein insertion efficiency factor